MAEQLRRLRFSVTPCGVSASTRAAATCEPGRLVSSASTRAVAACEPKKKCGLFGKWPSKAPNILCVPRQRQRKPKKKSCVRAHFLLRSFHACVCINMILFSSVKRRHRRSVRTHARRERGRQGRRGKTSVSFWSWKRTVFKARTLSQRLKQKTSSNSRIGITSGVCIVISRARTGTNTLLRRVCTG